MDNRPPNFEGNSSRNNRYSKAYGDYSGGYKAGGRYGPGYDNYGPGGGPNFMMGQGYGPCGPPPRQRHADFPPGKFLMYCGMTRDFVRNLPPPLLDLLRPEHCGVCGIEFDTEMYSRVHYNSKKHMKSLQKMIDHFHRNNSGISKKKEGDRYCELCDVELTSVQHADSHFSGKQHRAIIEGRKPPRNPLLLQRGMEGRVRHLIRREKNSLKSGSEGESAAQTSDTTVKKPINPDLYCEICKTSMTSSEQMTLHYNGKKHITKEKMHILSMLNKGGDDKSGAKDIQNEGKNGGKESQDKDDDVKEEEEETNPVKKDEENADVKEQDNGSNDAADDWQNGGGDSWDH